MIGRTIPNHSVQDILNHTDGRLGWFQPSKRDTSKDKGREKKREREGQMTSRGCQKTVEATTAIAKAVGVYFNRHSHIEVLTPISFFILVPSDKVNNAITNFQFFFLYNFLMKLATVNEVGNGQRHCKLHPMKS